MCGGLCGIFAKNNPNFQTIFLINFGRVLTYTILGFLFAGLVQGFVLKIPIAVIGFWMRSLLGLMLMFLGVRILLNKSNLPTFFSNNYLWKKTNPLLYTLNNKSTFFSNIAKGLIWGLIPCGLLYGVLIAAASTQNAFNGGLFMFAFGIGTMPSMIVTISAISKFKNKLQSKSLRFGAGIFILIVGFWTTLSPWVSHELIPQHPVFTSIIAFLDSCVP
jgi:sulfite exporter TauE/SafE